MIVSTTINNRSENKKNVENQFANISHPTPHRHTNQYINAVAQAKVC